METKLNVALSREVSAQSGAANTDCYRNSFRAMAFLPGALYVEGWVISSIGHVTHHGWLEYEGQVVDPTPLYAELAAARYFPGVRYNLAEAIRHASRPGREGTLPFVDRGRFAGVNENAAYREARAEACRAAYGDEAT
jgi:hypothetical protein